MSPRTKQALWAATPILLTGAYILGCCGRPLRAQMPPQTSPEEAVAPAPTMEDEEAEKIRADGRALAERVEGLRREWAARHPR